MSRTKEYRSALVRAAGLAGASMLNESDHPAHHWKAHEESGYRRYLDFNSFRNSYWDAREPRPDCN
jgi:hypothetical protein